MKHHDSLQFFSISLSFLIFLFLTANIVARDIDVSLELLSDSRLQVKVELMRNPDLAVRDISFLQNIADVSALGGRIENFAAFDANGNSVEVVKLIDGEFRTSRPARTWQYVINPKVPAKLTDTAHISWMSKDLGLLMTGDLIPQFKLGRDPVSARIALVMPPDWRVRTGESVTGQMIFEVKNIENAIFLIGKNIREKTIQLDKTTLSFAFSGDWQFSDEEALEMATSILVEYKSIFKEIPHQKININLLPFPADNSQPDRWRAETRGSTVTILSGSLPYKSQAVQRLHEQLRHEIFHLWMPNSLALTGNYDWFYEGFTIYQALRTGVELKQIRFEDFLNTLGRAFEMSNILSESQQITLLEAAGRRWLGTGNLVYAKGLVVAFLCEVRILQESKGRRDLKTVFQQLYQKLKKPNQIQDGNSAITRILKTFPELNLIVQNYIEGSSKIDWQNELREVGLESERDGFKTRLKVTAKPGGRQKDLLDKLGYNHWRKLLQKTK